MDIVSTFPRSWRLTFLSTLMVCFVCGGCSETTPMGTVKGTVTLDEKPYADAGLMFVDLATGQAGAAEIQADGSFALAGPIPVGNYTVFLTPKSDEGASMEEAAPSYMSGDLPQKYYNEAESDIKVQIKEGENNVTVELKMAG